MFQDKLEAELASSLDLLLPRRFNYFAKKQFPQTPIKPIEPASMILLQGPVEFNPMPKKKKKWNLRNATLQANKLVITKSEVKNFVYFIIIQCN